MTFPTFTVLQPPAAGTDLTQSTIFHTGGGGPANLVEVLSTNLAGQINWFYDPVANNFNALATTVVPGGTVFLLGGTNVGPAATTDLRQINLAGEPLRETNVNAIDAELAAMGVKNPIVDINHEAVLLPNGDTAILATDVETIPLNGTPTKYEGQQVIVLNQNFQVVWDWDGFNWLSTSRLPTNPQDINNGVVDWMHANSIAWSPADDNLIVSVRSQDWAIKINYANGTGDGHIIWRLGPDGNFTLPPGTDPTAWFSHQHDVTYINDTTILVFDDGDTRQLTNPNTQSRGQEWVLNEQTMTATPVVNANLGVYDFAVGRRRSFPTATSHPIPAPSGQLPIITGNQSRRCPTAPLAMFRDEHPRVSLLLHAQSLRPHLRPAPTGASLPESGQSLLRIQPDGIAANWSTFTGGLDTYGDALSGDCSERPCPPPILFSTSAPSAPATSSAPPGRPSPCRRATTPR